MKAPKKKTKVIVLIPSFKHHTVNEIMKLPLPGNREALEKQERVFQCGQLYGIEYETLCNLLKTKWTAKITPANRRTYFVNDERVDGRLVRALEACGVFNLTPVEWSV